MNQALPRILVALSVFGSWGVTPYISAAESGGKQDASAPTKVQTAEPQTGADPVAAAIATATENEPSAEVTPESEPKPAAETESVAETQSAAEIQKEAIAEKAPATVTGAFGIPLGEPFDPCMVATIISQEEKIYKGRDQAELEGTLYRVEPKESNTLFTRYSVSTTVDGIIYSISGDYESTEKAPKCDVTKELGAFLEGKYGKPRGKGMLGEWYSFRDMSSSRYRGVRLYAPRCRHGRYSIVYSDDNAKMAEALPVPEPTETSGL